MINTQAYQRSINLELDAIKNRVRDLIADANWPEEGRYKEGIIKKIIQSKLPANLQVSTGFIVEHISSIENIVSNQIDILIYDTNIPPLFIEGDFVIVSPSSVKAIIEVKSKVRSGRTNKNSLYQIAEKFNNLNKFNSISSVGRNRIFRGVISFEYETTIKSKAMDDSLRKSNGLINHFSLGGDVFIRHWLSSESLEPPLEEDCEREFYNVYALEGLSHAYFISNLIHMVTNEDISDRYFFSFPIPGTKEVFRKKTVCL